MSAKVGRQAMQPDPNIAQKLHAFPDRLDADPLRRRRQIDGALGWRRALPAPRPVQHKNLAVDTVLGGDGLGYDLERVDVPATPADHLTDLRRNSGNLNDDRLLPADATDANEFRAVDQSDYNPLHKFQDRFCSLRHILRCSQIQLPPLPGPQIIQRNRAWNMRTPLFQTI